MRLRLVLFALTAIAASTGPLQDALAADGDASFAVKPVVYDATLPATKSYFVYSAPPGAVIKSRIRVSNTGARPGTALLYPVDATTGQTSGTVYRLRRDPRRDVGGWIRTGQERLALAPGASVVVPFTITVPKSAGPGDHIGGLVAENTEVTQPKTSGALQIKIRHLTIAAVVVQVPGAAPALLAATGLEARGEHGYQYLYLHLQNPGGLALKPRGTVTVTDAAGAPVVARSFQLDTFVPRTAIDYPILLPGRVLKPGTYHASVTLSYGASALGYRRDAGPARSLTRDFDFTVSGDEYKAVFKGAAPVAAPGARASTESKGSGPMTWLVVVVAVIAAITLAVVLVSRRRRRAVVEPGTDAEPAAGAVVSDPAPSATGSAVAKVAADLLEPAQVESMLQEHLATGHRLSEILAARGYLDEGQLQQLVTAAGASNESGSALSSPHRG